MAKKRTKKIPKTSNFLALEPFISAPPSFSPIFPTPISTEVIKEPIKDYNQSSQEFVAREEGGKRLIGFSGTLSGMITDVYVYTCPAGKKAFISYIQYYGITYDSNGMIIILQTETPDFDVKYTICQDQLYPTWSVVGAEWNQTHANITLPIPIPVSEGDHIHVLGGDSTGNGTFGYCIYGWEEPI